MMCSVNVKNLESLIVMDTTVMRL